MQTELLNCLQMAETPWASWEQGPLFLCLSKEDKSPGLHRCHEGSLKETICLRPPVRAPRPRGQQTGLPAPQ